MQDMQLGIYSSFAGFNMFLIVRFGLFVSKNIRLNEYRLSIIQTLPSICEGRTEIRTLGPSAFG
jgi:hypothetical protein